MLEKIFSLASYELYFTYLFFLFSLNGMKRQSPKIELYGKSVPINISKKSNTVVTLVVLLTRSKSSVSTTSTRKNFQTSQASDPLRGCWVVN
ncbi:hypothetical protein H5410_062114 [Solanum commersonii]|uniref:Uncharacterized protein n=1 Tax=Solanum commersonii TaxID=4109 RepID=A0A9J5WAP3_SOLCO|nr:hypothetical protein H5410_062114 [Solanum commersonii]